MQAYIGGIVQMSTVDWPKNVCTVVFFAGCDFNCPYCQNSTIIEFKEEFLKDLKIVKEDIRKNLDFIDAVLFSGGEPCLQRGPLLELASYAKKLHLKVGIETNGSKPEVIMNMLNEGLLDFVGLDIKAPLNDVKLFEKATKSQTFFKTTDEVVQNLRQTLMILKQNQDRLQIEIRTTICPGITYKKEDLLAIAEEIKELDCRWSLQQFRPDIGTILDPMLRNVNSPTKEFLENMKEAVLKKYHNMRIDVKAV
ncbi:MAG: anaerobic ribonucleoside-triphosphate reductase activating protein [Candidatus Woesearchaeota archaeon]